MFQQFTLNEVCASHILLFIQVKLGMAVCLCIALRQQGMHSVYLNVSLTVELGAQRQDKRLQSLLLKTHFCSVLLSSSLLFFASSLSLLPSA